MTDSTLKKAVVLLSGGLDSATTLAIAKAEGLACYALSFLYGQRHAVELDAARRIAAALGVARHAVMEIDLAAFGGSALTADLPVPTGRTPGEIGEGIPLTYVPARNTIFLSFALGWAEVLGAGEIHIGVNALDYSGYPDCRPEYIAAWQAMADLATKATVEGGRIAIRAPLIAMTKRQIIEKGLALGVDYRLTSSCYSPTTDGAACGECDACVLRLRGFAEAGQSDPARYRAGRGSPR